MQACGLQSLLGYKDPRMAARYSHLSDEYLRKAVNAVNLGATIKIREKNGTNVAPSR